MSVHSPWVTDTLSGILTTLILLLAPTGALRWCEGAGSIPAPIVLTQLPVGSSADKAPPVAEGMLRSDYGAGGRIVALHPDGTLDVLTDGFSGAGDPDVSLDGKRVLFAGRRKPNDHWNIWEMNADGSAARPITRDLGQCRAPAYQSTLYTIVSTQPWYQIMFVSTAAGAMNEHGSGPASSLYSCKLDGTTLRRLTFNLSDDLDPFLMADGRVLLASWQRVDLRRGPRGRVSLFGVNMDGTDYGLFCGDEGQRIKHMPCVTTNGLAVFVEAERVGWDGAGQLACVTLRRNFHSYRAITNDPRLLYHSPSPLRDGTLLVSRRPADGRGTHGVYRLDPETGRTELIHDDPQFHDVQARLLLRRPKPDGRSSIVNEKTPTGRLYCLNVHLSDPDIMRDVKPGTIKGLRVLEGVPLPAGSAAGANGIPPVVQKRLLGEIPVEEDGSFNVEIPADTPIQLQTVDANGMAVRTCSWIWAKHREPRGCIGCHEDPELTPENAFVRAVQRPSTKLLPPPEERRTVDFWRDVMPVISRKCARCHVGGKTPLRLDGASQGKRGRSFNWAYESLLATLPGDGVARGKYVVAGRACASPLIWRLHGANTSHPWDGVADSPPGASMPPADAESLTKDEKQIFVEWIDLGALWDGIPGDDALSRGTMPKQGKKP